MASPVLGRGLFSNRSDWQSGCPRDGEYVVMFWFRTMRAGLDPYRLPAHLNLGELPREGVPHNAMVTRAKASCLAQQPLLDKTSDVRRAQRGDHVRGTALLPDDRSSPCIKRAIGQQVVDDGSEYFTGDVVDRRLDDGQQLSVRVRPADSTLAPSGLSPVPAPYPCALIVMADGGPYWHTRARSNAAPVGVTVSPATRLPITCVTQQREGRRRPRRRGSPAPASRWRGRSQRSRRPQVRRRYRPSQLPR
jgi:hypothetical protein